MTKLKHDWNKMGEFKEELLSHATINEIDIFHDQVKIFRIANKDKLKTILIMDLR